MGYGSASDYLPSELAKAIDEGNFPKINEYFEWRKYDLGIDYAVRTKNPSFIADFIKTVRDVKRSTIAALLKSGTKEVAEEVLGKIDSDNNDLVYATMSQPDLPCLHEKFFNLLDLIDDPEDQERAVKEGIANQFKEYVLNPFKQGRDCIRPLIDALGRRAFLSKNLQDVAIQETFVRGAWDRLQKWVEEFYSHPAIRPDIYATGLRVSWRGDTSHPFFKWLLSHANKPDLEAVRNTFGYEHRDYTEFREAIEDAMLKADTRPQRIRPLTLAEQQRQQPAPTIPAPKPKPVPKEQPMPRRSPAPPEEEPFRPIVPPPGPFAKFEEPSLVSAPLPKKVPAKEKVALLTDSVSDDDTQNNPKLKYQELFPPSHLPKSPGAEIFRVVDGAIRTFERPYYYWLLSSLQKLEIDTRDDSTVSGNTLLILTKVASRLDAVRHTDEVAISAEVNTKIDRYVYMHKPRESGMSKERYSEALKVWKEKYGDKLRGYEKLRTKLRDAGVSGEQLKILLYELAFFLKLISFEAALGALRKHKQESGYTKILVNTLGDSLLDGGKQLGQFYEQFESSIETIGYSLKDLKMLQGVSVTR